MIYFTTRAILARYQISACQLLALLSSGRFPTPAKGMVGQWDGATLPEFEQVQAWILEIEQPGYTPPLPFVSARALAGGRR